MPPSRSEEPETAVPSIRLPEIGSGDPRQNDIAHMFSHDIKNRLSVLVGFVRLLREGQLDRRHAAEALDVIEGSAHEAMSLTLNFLHAEDSGGGSFRLYTTPASLNQIVANAIEDETPRSRLRRVNLQTALASGMPLVDLDVPMLSRAVTNLLSNAIQYSPDGGVVHLETSHCADTVMLKVRDSGPGVPVEQVPDLFQRYGRGENAASSRSTGLGLYLVRKIAEAHGGSVSATFPSDGGSAFVLILPRTRDGDA